MGYGNSTLRCGLLVALCFLASRLTPGPSLLERSRLRPDRSSVVPPRMETGREDAAGINITADDGQPIANTGFTTNLARTAHTPVVARGGTAAATVSATADYRRFGREILGIRLDIEVIGGSGYITASPPWPPFKDTALTGFDRTTGRSVPGRIGFADPTFCICSMDGTVPTSTDAQPLLTGALECKD